MSKRADYIDPGEARELWERCTAANRLALEIADATGLRIGDVVKLQRKDVDAGLRNGWLPVTEEKTGRRRRIRMPRELLERAQIHANGGRWVFPHRTDKRRHRTRWAPQKQLYRMMCRDPRTISPHSYRKLFAVKMYRATGDLEKVRRAMGHARLETTILYATSDVLTAAKAEQRRRKRQHRRRDG